MVVTSPQLYREVVLPPPDELMLRIQVAGVAGDSGAGKPARAAAPRERSLGLGARNPRLFWRLLFMLRADVREWSYTNVPPIEELEEGTKKDFGKNFSHMALAY